MTKRIPPFKQTVDESVKAFGVTRKDALDGVQAQYARFKDRNERLLERHLDNVNTASFNFISQLTTLAILSVTVTGYIASQTILENSSSVGRISILLTFFLELTSVLFALIAHNNNVQFYRDWSKCYHDIDSEVEEGINSGKIQYISDLGKIESKHIKRMRESTPKIIERVAVCTAIIGLITLGISLWSVLF